MGWYIVFEAISLIGNQDIYQLLLRQYVAVYYTIITEDIPINKQSTLNYHQIKSIKTQYFRGDKDDMWLSIVYYVSEIKHDLQIHSSYLKKRTNTIIYPI